MSETARALVIEIMLHDDRWHGHSEWPPSPFRLYQALVAAAARGARMEETDVRALGWLEKLDAPVIMAPRTLGAGTTVQTYVPNNDLDAVDGNPDRVEQIRAPKRTTPHLLQGRPRFLYVWSFEMDEGDARAHVRRLEAITARLYQFGRGIDMAWARAHVLRPDEAEAMLRRHPGSRHEPCARGGGGLLAAPVAGSLQSLRRRFEAFRSRLQGVQGGRSAQLHFHQPPKPVLRMVGYACPPRRQTFEIRATADLKSFAPVMQRHVASFTGRLRDMAAQRLLQADFPKEKVERFLVGRNAGAQDKKRRVRILPLPSIGHEFAGGAIRRVLVEVPRDCPLDAKDVFWAFQGECFDPESGELTGRVLKKTGNDAPMLDHYGVGREAVLWRTITPAALPARRYGRAGGERLVSEEHAAAAVRTALRHAGIRARPVDIRVQREPFHRNSHMAGEYEPDRFDPRQLWHVEILFDRSVEGLLVIGNGRYLGLGLMAPVPARKESAEDGGEREEATFVFALPGEGLPAEEGERLLKVMRAALMKLDGSEHRNHRTCTLFSGHPECETAPLREGHHAHVFLAAPPDHEGRIRRLYVLPPWLADRSDKAGELARERTAHLSRIVGRLKALYAPDLPRLPLVRERRLQGDPLLGTETVWRTATPYLPTRHPKGGGKQNPEAFIEDDIRRECARRNLQQPARVDVLSVEKGPRGGLRARCELRFAHPVKGPFLLGRGSHRGKGCFVAVPGR